MVAAGAVLLKPLDVLYGIVFESKVFLAISRLIPRTAGIASRILIACVGVYTCMA